MKSLRHKLCWRGSSRSSLNEFSPSLMKAAHMFSRNSICASENSGRSDRRARYKLGCHLFARNQELPRHHSSSPSSSSPAFAALRPSSFAPSSPAFRLDLKKSMHTSGHHLRRVTPTLLTRPPLRHHRPLRKSEPRQSRPPQDESSGAYLHLWSCERRGEWRYRPVSKREERASSGVRARTFLVIVAWQLCMSV